jgi:hypothetical protein
MAESLSPDARRLLPVRKYMNHITFFKKCVTIAGISGLNFVERNFIGKETIT